MRFIFPPPLQSGDRVTVVAPSGALKELTNFEKGVEIWRSRGYDVEFGLNWQERDGYLAGNDLKRRQALQMAWNDPQCKAILCVRGGYGSMRLLEDWRWNQAITPKWVIGFSDITALLWSLAKIGIGGVHAPLLTTLATEPLWSQERLFDCVEGRSLGVLMGKGWGGGIGTGRLLPANLAVATAILGTPLQPDLNGVILALEDVSEAPYRLDRLLTQWRLTGAFQGVVGIALGRFSRCDPPLGSDSWGVEQVLRDRLEDLGIPIVSGLPFGHDGENGALPSGKWVKLDGDQGILEIVNND